MGDSGDDHVTDVICDGYLVGGVIDGSEWRYWQCWWVEVAGVW